MMNRPEASDLIDDLEIKAHWDRCEAGLRLQPDQLRFVVRVQIAAGHVPLTAPVDYEGMVAEAVVTALTVDRARFASPSSTFSP